MVKNDFTFRHILGSSIVYINSRENRGEVYTKFFKQPIEETKDD